MQDKVELSFEKINWSLKDFDFPATEAVVGIATGGIVPAALVAHQLEVPLYTIRISFRDDENNEKYSQPVAVDTRALSAIVETNLLLVDDVSVTGKTMEVAKDLFSDKILTTFVMKGKADLVLFPDISTCVNWPWKS